MGTGWRSVASVLVTLFASGAVAHPPNGHGHGHPGEVSHIQGASRAWTNVDTGEVVHGSFLAARSINGVTRVSIEREDGGVVVIAMEDLTADDQAEASRMVEKVRAINEHLAEHASALRGPSDREAPQQAEPFEVFAPFVSTRWDDRWLYVESDGLPHLPGKTGGASGVEFSHPLMVGITAWQQQVPLPQLYRGSNAWQIPLSPEIAETPVSAKEQLYRGAIALAANGVPIFNPIKNDGRTDTLLAGELDEYGGHCGRADDYHYHVAPTHLQQLVRAGQPIAYALDGFPIYGLFDPDVDSEDEHACPLESHEPLDALNGHYAPVPDGAPAGTTGLYHYHASEQYPYLNGGMRGVVTVRNDQIEPQPRSTPVRDWLRPLRGAEITGFQRTGKDDEHAWSLEYRIEGQTGFVNYSIEGDGEDSKYHFEFIAPDGTRSTSTYSLKRQNRDDAERGDEKRREGGVRANGQ